MLEAVDELARSADGDAEMLRDILHPGAAVVLTHGAQGLIARERHADGLVESRVDLIPELQLEPDECVEEGGRICHGRCNCIPQNYIPRNQIHTRIRKEPVPLAWEHDDRIAGE